MEIRKNIAKSVKSRIQTLENGRIFSCREFEEYEENKEAVIKALNRLAENGEIHKFSKGKFYKAEKKEGIFLVPEEEEIIKDLLMRNGKIIGYKTGWKIFNLNKLVQEKGETICIACNSFKPPLQRGDFTINFIVQKNKITKKNIKVLQMLDCIKMLQGKPDNTKNDIVSVLRRAISKFDKQEKETLEKCSLKYPAKTRILLSEIMEIEKKRKPTYFLQDSSSPIIAYTITLMKIEKFVREKWGTK